MAIIENIKKRIRLKNIYRNIKSREFDKALSLIEEIEEEKLDEHFLYALSLVHMFKNQDEESLKAIDKAIEKDPQNPAMIVQKAKILQLQKKYQDSVQLLESSRKLTIFNEEILYIQAINYLALNDLNHANDLFYEALKTIDKRFIESRIALAVELFILKNSGNTGNQAE